MLSCDLGSTISALNTLIITYQPPLSLAMCFELEAHLSQIDGITVNLIGQNHDYFDYEDSQIGAIAIEAEFSLELDLLVKADQKLSLNLTSLSFLVSDSGSDTTNQTDYEDLKQVKNQLLGLILNQYGKWQMDFKSSNSN